jgi:hypothetical protein
MTEEQRDILEALELPEPPRYNEFEPLNGSPHTVSNDLGPVLV